MNIDQLTRLILTIFILSVSLYVLVYSLMSYNKSYLNDVEREKLKSKIKSNLYLIIPLGSFVFLFFILLLYAFIMDKNVFSIIKEILENFYGFLKMLRS